jgi:hypothetical protein
MLVEILADGTRRLVLNGGPSPGGARRPGREARRGRALRGGGRVGGRSLGRILDVFNRRATQRTGPAARHRRREPFNTSLLGVEDVLAISLGHARDIVVDDGGGALALWRRLNADLGRSARALRSLHRVLDQIGQGHDDGRNLARMGQGSGVGFPTGYPIVAVAVEQARTQQALGRRQAGHVQHARRGDDIRSAGNSSMRSVKHERNTSAARCDARDDDLRPSLRGP